MNNKHYWTYQYSLVIYFEHELSNIYVDIFQENMEVRVARIFNTYGPRMHMNDGRVVSNFILQALQNESITVIFY